MKKILLTSAGFENPVIQDEFMKLVKKDVKNIKALFITTAAIEPDAIMVLPKCLEDLFHCGISFENIKVYDMHKLIDLSELLTYDVVYVCGGDTKYLVQRMQEIGFKESIETYLSEGGIYIGVSAGSVAACGNYKNGLHFIKNKIDVHCEIGSKNGCVLSNEDIFLTNSQAILMKDNDIFVIS